jgi:hypothetical protein
MRLPLGGSARPRRPRARALGAVLLLLAAASWAGPAGADVITLTGTGYQLTTPAGVSAVYDGIAGTFPNTGAPFSGTLTIDASFSVYASITLTFTQTMQVGGTAAAGGLRLALDTLMSNQTSTTWTGFTYQLVDTTDLSNVNTGSQSFHLAVAHFHPQANPNYTTTVFNVLQGADNNPLILLGGAMLPPNNEFTLKDALLHERNYNDATTGNPVLRTFNLVLTPIPEPSSLALLALGSVALAAYARRRAGG